jgi:hypothetical protein
MCIFLLFYSKKWFAEYFEVKLTFEMSVILLSSFQEVCEVKWITSVLCGWR